MRAFIIALAGTALVTACGNNGGEEPTPEPETGAETPAGTGTAASGATVEAGEDFQTRLQTALIEAEEGATITLPAGTFAMTDGLSLDVNGLTLTGAGQG